MGKFYDDPSYSYLNYWQAREYENIAEVIAIKRLLNGKHFNHAADIGGGYGRLSEVLTQYATDVDLVEPSERQREMAKEYLKGQPIGIKDGQLDNLPYKDGELDLAIVVRVSHHVPDLTQSMEELARVMESGATVIFEVANSNHFKARVRSWAKGKAIPLTPRDIATDSEVPFVNHHPKTVEKLLKEHGFVVEKKLSVSNMRSPGLKRIIPTNLLVWLEKVSQKSLGSFYFGPSIFYLLKFSPKAKN